MKVVNKQGKLAALALVFGALTLGNATDGFAQSAAATLRALQNTGYVMAQGVNYSWTGVDINVPIGSDNLYMRGQNAEPGPIVGPIVGGNGVSLGEQINPPIESAVPEATNDKNFWATTYYSSFVSDATEGSDRGWLVDITKYKMKRLGVLGGVTKDVTPNTKMGWYVGYSQGEMNQGVPFEDGTEIFDAEIKLTDFQFGGTFKHTFENSWVFNASVVGGAQNYSWGRYGTKTYKCYCSEDCSDPSHIYEVNEAYKGATSGNTFSANIALSRKYDLQNDWYITPTVGVESAHSWIYCGSEAGQTRNDISNVWEPYKLTEKIQFSRNTARIGALLGYAHENFSFYGKAYYGTQLGGDDAPEITLAELDQEEDEAVAVNGSGFGRDTLQLGGGLSVALDETKTTTLGGGYDAMLYKRATSQTMTATFTKRF